MRPCHHEIRDARRRTLVLQWEPGGASRRDSSPRKPERCDDVVAQAGNRGTRYRDPAPSALPVTDDIRFSPDIFSGIILTRRIISLLSLPSPAPMEIPSPSHFPLPLTPISSCCPGGGAHHH